MAVALAVATAATFIWLGMVVAISFIEAPLKFRAPGVTMMIGLGIGRLVFRALNRAETILAIALLVAVVTGPSPAAVTAAAVATVAVLTVQLLVVRPGLNRRSDAILAGGEAPRSRSHFVYIGLELAKVAGLVTTGILLLAQ